MKQITILNTKEQIDEHFEEIMERKKMIGLDTNEVNENKQVMQSTFRIAIKMIWEFIIIVLFIVAILYLPSLLQTVNQSVN